MKSLKIDESILNRIDEEILCRSGSVFFSCRETFQNPSDYYILGLNPGGDPRDEENALYTIQENIKSSENLPIGWAAYMDEKWRGEIGQHKMQRRVQHLLSKLRLDIRRVPVSNVVFVRTRSEAELNLEKAKFLDACWPFHQAVIDNLGVRNILCLGQTAGTWVREKLKAHNLVAEHVEENRRKWRSQAHLNQENICVFTLTHPSWANWCNPNADPSEMILKICERK